MTDFGKIAYEAYSNSSDGKSLINDTDLPDWEDVRPEIKTAWRAAAEAVIVCHTGIPN